MLQTSEVVGKDGSGVVVVGACVVVVVVGADVVVLVVGAGVVVVGGGFIPNTPYVPKQCAPGGGLEAAHAD